MKKTDTFSRDLHAEHDHYLARIEPIIRKRLIDWGLSEEKIDAFISELPAEHFVVQIQRVMRKGVSKT